MRIPLNFAPQNVGCDSGELENRFGLFHREQASEPQCLHKCTEKAAQFHLCGLSSGKPETFCAFKPASEPLPRLLQPGALLEQPESLLEQPGVLLEQPGALLEQPGVLLEQPGVLLEQPGSVGKSSLLQLFDQIDVSGQVVGVAVEPRPAGVCAQGVAFVPALLLE